MYGERNTGIRFFPGGTATTPESSESILLVGTVATELVRIFQCRRDDGKGHLQMIEGGGMKGGGVKLGALPARLQLAFFLRR